MQTPVALIIFNRAQTTARVVAELARVRPSKVFVIADGPRPDRPDDVEKCAAARKVIERIDWDCEVVKNYSDVNLGCGRRPASGISWVFEHVERAIFLEDDCVPHPTFFRFCDEVLERYADDERVMMVSGNNLLPEGGNLKHSYTFFRFLNLWGWASWRRAWKHYDFEMNAWPRLRGTNWLESISPEPAVQRYWKHTYDEIFIHADRFDVWDFQFAFAVMERGGFGIAPDRNLVSNIGFGEDATHTFGESELADYPSQEMPFPLVHPPGVAHDADYDQRVFHEVFQPGGPPGKCRSERLREEIETRIPLPVRRWWFRRQLARAAERT